MTEKLTNLLIGLQMSIFDSEVREDIYQVFKDCIGQINNLPESGVIITQVMENSLAQRAGFQVGDLIKKISGQPTPTAIEVQQIMESIEVEEFIEVEVGRKGNTEKLIIRPD